MQCICVRLTRSKQFFVPPDLRIFFGTKMSVRYSGESFLARKFIVEELFLAVAFFLRRDKLSLENLKSHVVGATKCEISQ